MKQFCKRGHDRTLPGAVYKNQACVLCRKARSIAHREEEKARSRARREERKAYYRARYIAHREERKAYDRAYRATNRAIKTLLTSTAILEFAKQQDQNKGPK